MSRTFKPAPPTRSVRSRRPLRVLGVAAAGAVAIAVVSSGAVAYGASAARNASAGSATAAKPAASAKKQLVIYDNDTSSYGATSLLPLLGSSHVTLLGTTTVTGDVYASQGTKDALSFLQKIGKKDLPVAEGYEYPLINTPARSYAWEKLYGGTTRWLGAFNASTKDPTKPAVTSGQYTEPPFGWPTTLHQTGIDATDFLIKEVRAHPHQVTIVTAGPLTNVAAAVRKDPAFASLAKGIVIGGGNLYQLAPGETDPKFDSSSNFNFRFDPESAHIVLTAAWRSTVVVGDATTTVLFDNAMLKAIKSKDTPASEYVAKAGYTGYPIWDETTAAVAADPSLITKSIKLRMDVDISGGIDYGLTRVWSDQDAPHLGEDEVTYVQAVNAKGVANAFIDSTHELYNN